MSVPTYLLDSDICIYALSGRYPAVAARFDQLQPGEAVIPVIAYGELSFGAVKSRNAAMAMAQLQALARTAAVAELPPEAAGCYAHIRRELEVIGKPIGPNDAWIAAHALAADLVLVTNNEREFRRVPGLRVENWATSRVAEKRPRYRRRRDVGGGTAGVEVDPVADLAPALGIPEAELRAEVDRLLAGV